MTQSARTRAMRTLLWLSGALSLLLNASCADLDPQVAEIRPAPLDELQASQTLAQAHVDPGASPAVDWWSAFGAEQLNRIESEALASNPSLDLARARQPGDRDRRGPPIGSATAHRRYAGDDSRAFQRT